MKYKCEVQKNLRERMRCDASFFEMEYLLEKFPNFNTNLAYIVNK